MVYETYQTEGFVLAGRNSGEGNKLFHIFTEDLGLVYAHAQNIRSEKSKLRYQLQPLSKARVSLVRGKEYWRVVGVEDARFLFWDEGKEKGNLILVQRIFNLLLRFVHGEEVHRELFTIVARFLAVLQTPGLLGEDTLSRKGIEILTVARMLHVLGYISSDGSVEKLFESPDISQPLLDIVLAKEKHLLTMINTALHESQL